MKVQTNWLNIIFWTGLNTLLFGPLSGVIILTILVALEGAQQLYYNYKSIKAPKQ